MSFTIDDDYVNRKKAEADFFDAIQGQESIVVIDMNARHWMGKTRTIQFLKEKIRDKGAIIGFVDLGAQENLVPNGDPETDEKVYDKYITLFIQVLANLAQDCFGIPVKKFHQGVNAELIKVGVDVEITVPLLAKFIVRKPKPEEPSARNKADQRRARAIQRFASQVRKYSKQQARIFLFLDNFCQVQGTLLEKWFLEEMLPELKGCKVVVGRAECDKIHSRHPGELKRVEIHEFTRAEVDDYVRKKLNVEGIRRISEDHESWSDLIYRVTRGNPMLVSWLAHSIKQEKLHLQPADETLISSSLSVSRDDQETLDALVERVCRREPELGHLINAACILRRFDYETLQFVTVDKIEDRYFEHAWNKLLNLPGISEDEGRITVNTLLAATREKVQRQTRSAYVDGIHQQAAQFYRQRLQDLEDESNLGIWDRFHRYEDPHFQFYNQRWLYHLAALRDKRQFILESATRYFDAFFWWGDYLHFPFCDQLIEDLNSLLVGRDNRQVQEWVELLGEFHATFKPKRERTADRKWLAACRSHVRQILDMIHPARAGDDEQADELHLQSLLISYLAELDWVESCGAADHPAYARAVRHFMESIDKLLHAEKLHLIEAHSKSAAEKLERKKLVELAERETWVVAWMWVWLVNLHAEHGQNEACLEACAAAEKAIQRADPSDLEAWSRIHAARGRVYLHQQEWEKALEEIKAYGLDTLGFLCSDYKTGGDLYTVEFFREMIEVIGSHLVQLQRQDAQLAQSWWQNLRAFWMQVSVNILPEGVAALPGESIADMMSLNPDGYVLDHHLPLPRLFVALDARTGQKQIIPKYLPKEFKQAYRELRSLS